MTREEIFEQAKALDPREREELIRDLNQLAEPSELTADQIAELHRRAEAVDRGELATVPGEQVMAELFKRLAR